MKQDPMHAQAVPFIAFLERYRHDRGALAGLRGALSDARRVHAWPLLGAFSGAVGNAAFEKVAGLWAWDPELNCRAGNLGHTLRDLADVSKSFEGRFKRLLTCSREEMPERIVSVVRAAQVRGCRVDYARLLSDLLWWGDEIRLAWAQAFWGPREEGEVAADTGANQGPRANVREAVP